MTLDDLYRDLPGHWAGVKVLSRDENGQPKDIEVVARDVDVLDSRALLKKGEEYCIVYTGNVPENRLTLMY